MLPEIPLKYLFKSFAISLLALIVLYLLDNNFSAYIWLLLSPDTALGEFPYCESLCWEDLFRQKVNVYSNIFYLFTGVLLIQLEWGNANYALKQDRNFSVTAVLLGIALIYLFFGSSIFHGSMIYLGKRLDINAMDAVLIGISLMAINRYCTNVERTYFRPVHLVLLFLIGTIVCFGLFFFINGIALFIGILAIAFIFSLLNYKKNPESYNLFLLLISLPVLIIAFSLHLMDKAHIMCTPESWLQFHSIWHAMTAVGAFIAYSFYKQEEQNRIETTKRTLYTQV